MAFTLAESPMRLGMPAGQAELLSTAITAAGGVASVTAGTGITVGGTATAPTVGLTNIPELTATGGTVIPTGTLNQTLQAILNVADPS
jgi:hypothetical protein